MASLDNRFMPNMQNAQANSQAVFTGPNYRISVLSERLIRLEYSQNGSFSDSLTTLVKNRKFNLPTFKVEQDEKFIVITTKYFMMQYAKNKPFLGPKFAPDSNLKISLLNTDKVWFYGQAEARNFKGGAISLDDYAGKVNLDKGLYSTDGFVMLDDSGNMEIDQAGFLQKPDPNKIDLYVFMYKRDFGLCLKDYFTLTGYPDIIPRYALGIWWNREQIYSSDDAISLVKAFNRYQIPLSVVLLSEFWHIKDPSDYNLYRSGFSFNRDLFPNPNEFISYMHERGIRVGINIDPVEGIRKEENAYMAMAQELGVLGGETIPFNVLDKNYMASFINHIIFPFLNAGVDIYWLDYKASLDGIQVLDYYYNKSFELLSNSRPLTLTRSPLVAPHHAGILYSGETIVSWDTLKYLPFYNGLAANKGVTWWSHDVGGYKGGTEDSELYLRYIEFSCFSPIFRFSAKRGLYYKREPWMWDVKTYTIAHEYCKLRHRLIPYLYAAAADYSRNGKPLVQPVYYASTEIYDEPLYINEYFFGKELFIAPITKPKDVTMNRSVERIFLPQGVWYDFKTGKKFIGDKRYVVFYKEEEYPVFARAGGIIPLAMIDDNINNTNPPQKMEIQVFPGENNIFRLYEDDGNTKLYQNGYYIVTVFDYRYEVNKCSLDIYPMEGKTEIIPLYRNYKIRFRNMKEPSKINILVNHAQANLRYETSVEDNDFIVDIKDANTTTQITIECIGNDLEVNAVRIIKEDVNSIISDLKIPTLVKERVSSIFFSDLDIKKKRIEVKKIKELDKKFKRMFIKLLEYISEI